MLLIQPIFEDSPLRIEKIQNGVRRYPFPRRESDNLKVISQFCQHPQSVRTDVYLEEAVFTGDESIEDHVGGGLLGGAVEEGLVELEGEGFFGGGGGLMDMGELGGLLVL